jgi:hypothetical protein
MKRDQPEPAIYGTTALTVSVRLERLHQCMPERLQGGFEIQKCLLAYDWASIRKIVQQFSLNN